MTPFTRALAGAEALARHLESRGLSPADLADAVLIEAIALVIADRGRAETARTLRLTAKHLEASNG